MPDDSPRAAVIADALLPLSTPIDSLAYDPHNARRGDVAAIRRSLNVFGQRKPVVARRTGTDAHGQPVGIVEAGNHTVRAAAELGWTHVAAVFVTDDETTAKAYALADNRTAELADWDTEQLADTLRELTATEFDIAALGWSEAELAQLVAEPSDDGEYDDDDDDEPIGPAPASVYDNDAIIDAAFEHYRQAGFPYPAMPRHQAMHEINALAALDTGKLEASTLAYRAADPYQLHRFTTRVRFANGGYAVTPLQAYERDDKLRRALMLAVDGGKVTDTALLGVLGYVSATQCAAQFRPAFALLMYRRYAPSGGTVLDTSTGFGGRLLGFFASDLGTYIGIDPNTVTSAGNKALAADLCPPSKLVELHELPAEDVPHESVAGRADFAFTSPPYFSKEIYSDEPTQSCVRYATGDDWRAGFLRPMLALQLAALKPGAYSAINIADVTIANVEYPLTEWTIDDAQRIGFEYLRTEQFPISRVPGRGEKADSFEPVVILRKPEERS